MSTDNAESWKAVNEGLTGVDFRALTLAGETLFAGTWDGVWRRPVDEMKTSAEERIPNGGAALPFSLRQNYPNPFNASTTIRLAVPRRESVTLEVFDLLGREVATLLDEVLPAGEHAVVFDAANLTSGVYHVRMRTGGFSKIRKIVVMK